MSRNIIVLPLKSFYSDVIDVDDVVSDDELELLVVSDDEEVDSDVEDSEEDDVVSDDVEELDELVV